MLPQTTHLITTVNLDAFSKIHVPQAKSTMHNTGFYDELATTGELNLDTLWHNEEHRNRRKVWDQVLASKCLNSPGAKLKGGEENEAKRH
ncbi:hypothetical protein CTA2_1380 [Colletotrichum tanaceti]|nr:hypothetical protein CTA2_1380 [Colletotrichum tanaceti]